MKYKGRFFQVAVLSLILLSSCDLFLFSSSSFVEGDGPGFYQTTATTITKKAFDKASDRFSLDSTGNQKILVVPVIFSDYSYSNNEKNEIHEHLNKAFFGAQDDTSWESVTSYYETSSYSLLHLSGEVTDFYEVPMTAKTFAQKTWVTGEHVEYFEPTWILAEDVITHFKTTEGRTFQEYDQDKDGFIDALWLVYLNPNYQNYNYSYQEAKDIFWAYTYWTYSNYYKSDVDSPVAMTYAFASYDFLYEGYGPTGIDAHTYIHETGHILGLDDYYTYDDDSQYNPLGGLDMMDENILDHNAYSKYFLGWTNPIYLDGTRSEVEITLDPFVSSGQFVLLNNGWNKSAFDEYLAFEFYTPTSLNEADSQPYGYPGNHLRGFSVPGIKVYHVDSRLAKYSVSNDMFINYTDTISNDNRYYVDLAMSNSKKYSRNADMKLIHLIEKSGTNTFKFGSKADNGSLFQKSSEFDPSSTHKYMFKLPNRFNDNSLIGYKMEVKDLSLTSATLKFTRIT